MATVFKFCSAASGAFILRNQSLYITGPLDLNDPFEMRPAWTDAHVKHHLEDREFKNAMMAGAPIFLATESGMKPMGRMDRMEEQPIMPVDSHRGIADIHNGKVFRLLHERFRVLSFATGILEIGESHAESKEDSTLLWSHYADSFQGVCLAFDTSQFENGIQDGGFSVTYSPLREGLPPDFYDVYRKLCGGSVAGQYPLPSEDPHWQAMIRFLTQKSPAWQYEQELRMIYDFADTSKRDKFHRVSTLCESCKSQQRPVDQCKNTTYRDAISVPPSAFRAVIIGTDVGAKETAEILRLLETPEFSHVLVYWSSLHSEHYVLQYNLDTSKRADEQSYVMHMQRLMEKQIAMAKEHTFMGPQGLKYRPSRKGICFAKPGDSDCGTGA